MANQPGQDTQNVSDAGTPSIGAPSGGTRVEPPSQAVPRTSFPDRPVEWPRLSGGKTPEMIAGYLKGLDFPAKKDAVIRTATHNGAPEEVIGAMRLLTATEYASFDDLLRDYPRLPEEDEVAGHSGRS